MEVVAKYSSKKAVVRKVLTCHERSYVAHSCFVTDPHVSLLSIACLGSRVESISLRALMNGALFPKFRMLLPLLSLSPLAQ
jgi:hypothetical protein